MAAHFVGQPLQHRLRGWMRMDVDKARQYRKATAVDLGRVAVTGRQSRADRGDRVPVDRQIYVTAIAMGLRRLVPGDEPGGVAKDFPKGRWVERFRHGIPSKQSWLYSTIPEPRP